MASSADTSDKIIIKKYANRRLYNTKNSAYITLEDLKIMIHENQDFIVQDAKTNKNITGAVLTQIILDEETKMEHGLLPVNFLLQMIRFYSEPSNNMLVPKFLESSMQTFCHNQQQFQNFLNQTFTSMFPKMPGEMPENSFNLMNMWNPFAVGKEQNSNSNEANANAPSREEAISMLNDQINHLNAEIARLSQK